MLLLHSALPCPKVCGYSSPSLFPSSFFCFLLCSDGRAKTHPKTYLSAVFSSPSPMYSFGVERMVQTDLAWYAVIGAFAVEIVLSLQTLSPIQAPPGPSKPKTAARSGGFLTATCPLPPLAIIWHLFFHYSSVSLHHDLWRWRARSRREGADDNKTVTGDQSRTLSDINSLEMGCRNDNWDELQIISDWQNPGQLYCQRHTAILARMKACCCPWPS